MSLSVPCVHALFAVPHAPLIGFGCVQFAFVPLLIPLQFQRYSVALSCRSFSVPVVQVFGVAAHVPFIGVAVLVAVHVGLVVPPLVPLHVHVLGVVVVGNQRRNRSEEHTS